MSFRFAGTRLLQALVITLGVAPCALAADVAVMWDAPDSGAPAGYHLFYGPSPGSTAYALHTGGQELTATLRGLDPGGTYYVRVHAHDALGRLSEPSNEIVIGVPTSAPVTSPFPPPVPGSLLTDDVSHLRTYESTRFPMLRRDVDATARLAIANPGDAAAVTLLVTAADGTRAVRSLSLPALAQRVVAVDDLMSGDWDRIDVTILASAPVGVERRETLGTPSRGGHGDVGSSAARTTWIFADGSTRAPLRTTYEVYNPTDVDADLTFLYLRASGAAVTRVHVVPAHGREVIDAALEGVEMAATDVGVQITSANAVPVYVERVVSLLDASGQVRGAHAGGGVEAPRAGWSFVDGATGPFFDLQLAIVNLAAATAQLAIDAQRADGTVVTRSIIVPAKRRVTLLLDTFDSRLADAVVSVTTRSLNGIPHVAEQVQWWGGSGASAWTDGHTAAPVTAPGPRWVIADGQSGGTPVHQTFALVRNLGVTDEEVRVQVLGSGGVVATHTVPIAAGARLSIDPATLAATPLIGTFGVLVEAVDGEAALVVQHVTYWSVGSAAWGGGVGVPATRLP